MAKPLDPNLNKWQTCPGGGERRAFDWPPDGKGYPGACVCQCSFGVLMEPGSLEHDVELVSGRIADIGKVARHEVRYGEQYPGERRPDLREIQDMRYTGRYKVTLESIEET